MKSSRDVRKVALLIETTRSYTRDMLSGVGRYAQAHGPWSTFLELGSTESKVPDWIHNWDGDGILTRTFSSEVADAIKATGLPAVELRSTNHNFDLSFVGMDNALVGQTVADHFLSRGYRRFAVYSLDSESFFRERLRNFVSYVTEAGGRCDELPAQSEFGVTDWEQHQEDLREWLAKLEKPVGIFACNDQLAFRVLDACARSGITVPEEVAVVGCENEEMLCDFASPPLTSVKFDGVAVGYRAAELLDRIMSGEVVEREEVLIPPKGIQIRGSSEEYVIDDPVVLKAVKLIRAQAFSDLNVASICEQLSVSRSTLERKMKTVLKRGAKEELLRVRFREVNRLLRNTDLTMEAISEMTGFSYSHYFQTAYRDRYGISPGEYRKKHQTRM